MTYVDHIWKMLRDPKSFCQETNADFNPEAFALCEKDKAAYDKKVQEYANDYWKWETSLQS